MSSRNGFHIEVTPKVNRPHNLNVSSIIHAKFHNSKTMCDDVWDGWCQPSSVLPTHPQSQALRGTPVGHDRLLENVEEPFGKGIS